MATKRLINESDCPKVFRNALSKFFRILRGENHCSDIIKLELEVSYDTPFAFEIKIFFMIIGKIVVEELETTEQMEIQKSA